jgi:hypothetical protein
MVSVKTAAAATTAESMMTTSGSKSRTGGDDELRIRSGGEGTGEVVYFIGAHLATTTAGDERGADSNSHSSKEREAPIQAGCNN